MAALSKSSDQAATLSFEHFRAFHLADPLESYAVRDVTRLDRRSIDSVGERGTPYIVVDLTLRQRSGAIDTTISVEGEVLGVVELDPTPVRVRAPAGVLLVDGAPTPEHPAGSRTLLLLAGAHSIAHGDTTVKIRTSPLEVVSGAGSLDQGEIVLDRR